MRQKGQLSTEFLVLLSVGVLILVPLLIHGSQRGARDREAVSEATIEQLCSLIVDRAKSMELVGANSWSTIKLKSGASIRNVEFHNRELVLTVGTQKGQEQLVCFTDVPMRVADTLPNMMQAPLGGEVEIRLEYKRGFVCLGVAGTECAVTACDDGRDNDDNNCSDFPQDSGCSYFNDTTEDGGICNPGVCGNSLLEEGETCDGTALPYTLCTQINEGWTSGALSCTGYNSLLPCTYDRGGCALCGNARVEGAEACDDADTDVNDECPANCQSARCGDGYRFFPSEECDDSNTVNGDGCESCLMVPPSSCRPAGSPVFSKGEASPIFSKVRFGVPAFPARAVAASSIRPDDVGAVASPGPLFGTSAALYVDGLKKIIESFEERPGGNPASAAYFPLEEGFIWEGDPPTDPCNDGNMNNNDGCLNNCRTAECGDGFNWNQSGGTEECDNYAYNSDMGTCDPSCRRTRCSDGFRQTPNGFGVFEQCDDGNALDTDTCADCVLTTCGDGTVQNPNGVSQAEECDDGNQASTDTCSASCTQTYCGDGIAQAPNGLGTGGPANDGVEQCDDANSLYTDTCNACALTYCGDFIAQPLNGQWQTEACDDGRDGDNSDECTDDCRLPSCGDGFPQGAEECDDGNLNELDLCTTACTWTFCGDARVQTPNGAGTGGPSNNGNEACDDGNPLNTDACLDTCVAASCGDGFIWFGFEECDGANLDGQTCASRGFVGGTLDCQLPTDDQACRFDEGGCNNCGNGQPNPGEECDDGNANNDDGCLNTCLLPTCGDGFVQAAVEDCEPSLPLGADCQSQGYFGGTLACNAVNCMFDESGCNNCGNGQRDPDELCDGTGTPTGCRTTVPSQTCAPDCSACWDDVCRNRDVGGGPYIGNLQPLYFASANIGDMDSATMVGNNIFASDRGNNQVEHFLAPASTMTACSPSVSAPWQRTLSLSAATRRMDYDSAGRFYVTEYDAGPSLGRVTVRNPPTYTATYGTINFYHARNVAVDDRDHVWIGSTSTIREFQASGSGTWTQVGSDITAYSGVDDLEVVQGRTLAIGTASTIFFLDTRTRASGGSFPSTGDGIASDGWGNILRARGSAHAPVRIEVFTPTGSLLGYVNNACGAFSDIDDIHLDLNAGALLVSDQDNNRVVALPGQGFVRTYIECTPPSCTDGICNRDERCTASGGIPDCGGSCPACP